MASQFHIYSDASFSHKKLIGVSGFILFKSAEENLAGPCPSALVKTFHFTEKNNIRAEFRGIFYAFDEIIKLKNKNTSIYLYTDCTAISNLLKRRKKLEANGFISAKKNDPLTNSDLYKVFFDYYDTIQPNIIWVKGHSPKTTQNIIQKNFSYIDVRVRKELRNKIIS